jgi:hypothetical protein
MKAPESSGSPIAVAVAVSRYQRTILIDGKFYRKDLPHCHQQVQNQPLLPLPVLPSNELEDSELNNVSDGDDDFNFNLEW